MSIDTTGSLTPIDLDTPLMVSPSGGDPTPLPQTRAADGTRQLKALPPPIPSRASTADLIAQPPTQTAELTAGVDAPIAAGTKTKLRAAPRATQPPPIPRTTTQSAPAIARAKTSLPKPNRAKGTVPPVRPLTADPDGWSVSAADSDTPLPPPSPAPADDDLRDIMSTDEDGPDSTRPTPFVEPVVAAPVAAEPSKEWLAKIDQVMRPEAKAPVLFTTNSELPTTKAAAEMFQAKAETPSLTQPLELVDLDEVAAPAASVVVTPSIAAPVVAAEPVAQPAPVWKPLPATKPQAHPAAAVAAAIGSAPQLPRPRRPSASPMAVPVVPAAPVSRLTGTGSAPVVDAAPAFEQSFEIEFDSPDMTSAHTTNFEMPMKQSFISKRMAIALAAGVGVMLLVILATRGGHEKPAATPPPAQTAQAPVAAPVAAPAPTPAAPAPAAQNVAAPVAPTQEVAAAPAATADSPAMIRMPVTSKPSGALVTFVDGGKAVVVGRTPTTIEIDPRSTHDIALTLLDHETQLVTIPTGGMTALVVDMGAAKTGGAVPTVAHVATNVAETRTETPAPKHHASAPAPKAAPVQHITQPAPREESAAAPSGAGMLMISSKPPCEIVVDGKSTHLMTPQKSIPLAAGNHTIVLVNAQQRIHKTLGVIITSKKSTKVIQDFTKH